MNESMSTPATNQPQDVVPPPTNRRPRVREVSSRFMNSTPVPGGEHPTLQHPVKTPKHSVSTPMPTQKSMMQRSKTDYPPHHHHHHHDTVIRRSYSDSPFTLHNYNKVPAPHSIRPRGASTRLVFKENKGVRSGEGSDNDDDSNEAVPQLRIAKSSNSSRPDTPATQRIVPSRFRQSGNSNLMSASAAAKLLQSTGLSLSSSAPKEHISDGKGTDEDECSIKSCPNSPLPNQNNNLQWNSSVRSSMPERACFTSNNGGESQLSSKLSSASSCSRSLNLLDPSVKMMGFNLSLPPPHPMPLTKQGDVNRKGRKLFNREEQVHSLKMLHNQHLQWNFVNAKSEASFHAQTKDAEVCVTFCINFFIAFFIFTFIDIVMNPYLTHFKNYLNSLICCLCCRESFALLEPKYLICPML